MAIVGIPSAAKIQIGSFTRDVSTASGNQAVTGVGFKPDMVLFIVGLNGGARASIGVDDGTSRGSIWDASNTSAGTWGVATTDAIHADSGGGVGYTGTVGSMDSDGFTIAWTKTGSPTGTVTGIYLAIKLR